MNLLLPEFLNLITKSSKYKNWVYDIQRGAAQPNINSQMYSAFEVPKIDIVKQKRIVLEFEKIEREISTIESDLKNTDFEKEQILKKYLK
ncbi:MAG: hypothetical protein JJE45_03995 [Prolixibacteraceae bacterium]|nr:hypothetical protein [Prolixibacteraceae bacterium]